MSKVFDVRKDTCEKITTLLFAEKHFNEGCVDYIQAHKIQQWQNGHCAVSDGSGFVVVQDEEHCDNLIKALNKAKELGWFKK